MFNVTNARMCLRLIRELRVKFAQMLREELGDCNIVCKFYCKYMVLLFTLRCLAN